MYEEEYADVIIVDDLDELEHRNAGRDHRSRTGTARTGVMVRRPSRRTGLRSSRSRSNRIDNGPIVRPDTGRLSTGMMVQAGAQVLAAIQSLPTAPVATGNVEQDVANLVLYQSALAEHAKRDEQLRTIGSLAAKLFA